MDCAPAGALERLTGLRIPPPLPGLHSFEPLETVSKVSDEDHDAGEPGKGEEPLDLPAMPVAAQRPTILQRGSLAIAPVRTDQLAVQTPLQFSKPIGIVGPVRNQPLRKP